MKSTKKIIIIPCLIFFFLFSFNVKKVFAWDAMAAAMAKQAMEEIYDNVKGITMASLKQTAIQMVGEEVDNLLSDLTGIGGGLITDWQDYLFSIPERESAAFMNDYLSDITQGRNSSRYRSVSVSKSLAHLDSYEGFGARNGYEFALSKIAQAQEETSQEKYLLYKYNYEQYLSSMVQDMVQNGGEVPQVTCTEEMSENMFSYGENFDNFLICTSGINYAPLARAHFLAIYQEELEKNREKQKAKQDGGFTGIEDKETGQTHTPAATVAAIDAKSKTMGMDVIVNAQSIPEVITAVVVQAINRSINQGIGAIKARGQRELANIRRQITGKTREEVQRHGPRAYFGNQTFYESQ